MSQKAAILSSTHTAAELRMNSQTPLPDLTNGHCGKPGYVNVIILIYPGDSTVPRSLLCHFWGYKAVKFTGLNCPVSVKFYQTAEL